MRNNKEKMEEIWRRIEAGENEIALAKEYGISRKTVGRIRKGRGQHTGGENMSLEWIAAFQKAWANIYPGDEERKRRQKEAENEVCPEVSRC